MHRHFTASRNYSSIGHGDNRKVLCFRICYLHSSSPCHWDTRHLTCRLRLSTSARLYLSLSVFQNRWTCWASLCQQHVSYQVQKDLDCFICRVVFRLAEVFSGLGGFLHKCWLCATSVTALLGKRWKVAAQTGAECGNIRVSHKWFTSRSNSISLHVSANWPFWNAQSLTQIYVLTFSVSQC